MSNPRRIVAAITGASGAIYARRVLQLLMAAEVQVHLVVSPAGQRLLRDELGIETTDATAILGLANARDYATRQIVVHDYRDIGAAIASGSFVHQGMVIVPCSSNTLSAVATGSAGNLLHRAAQATLKERRRLVLVHRETPLSLIDIRNMAAATEAGAIICPASPGFYKLPRTIDDLVDTLAARVLDLLGVEHALPVRWGENNHTRS